MRRFGFLRLALSAVAGLLWGSSVVMGPVPALAVFAPVLLLAALRGASFRQALLAGWLAGTICNAIALYWIVGLLQSFAYFPLIAALPVATLLFIAQGLVLGIGTAIAHSAAQCQSSQCGARLWLALPAAVVTVFSLSPFLFPWRLASSAVGVLPWAQVAELGGSPMLDGMMMLAGCAGYAAFERRRRVWLTLTILLVPFVYGLVRLPQVEESRSEATALHVGVVQPNVDIYDKHDAMQFPMHLQILQDMSVELERRGAELVIWPESAYPFPFPRGLGHDLRGRLAVRRADMHTPLLVGALTRASRCDRWNSALAIDSEGQVVGVSDKVELLAFGETVPLWDVLPPLQEMFPCPGIRRGRRPEVVVLEGTRLGVLNCYEDVLAAHGRSLAQQNPELLVNITNDAWFGDTLEPHLHQLVARLRSIETRRDLVRAVNTGVSSHISATGETLVETRTWVRTSFVATTHRLRGETLWVQIGDTTTPLAYAYLLSWLVIGLGRERRRRSSWRRASSGLAADAGSQRADDHDLSGDGETVGEIGVAGDQPPEQT